MMAKDDASKSGAIATPDAKTREPRQSMPEKDSIDLLAGMSRVVGKISELPAFSAHNLGLTEWLFLNHIDGSSESRAGSIGLKLGITPQRSSQIVDDLSKKGFITVSASAVDNRKKDLKITALGEKERAALNQEVTATVSQIKSFPKASQTVRTYSGMLAKSMRPVK